MQRHGTQIVPQQVICWREITEPSPVPTATAPATAVPTIATVKPTSQQTQKSPAPVFGIIAGLGAAAVLLRLRR